MVAPSSPRLDFVPVVNLARTFLFRAADALEAGRIVEAGVLLREAVRRQLHAECAWKGCLPKKRSKHLTPAALLDALRRAGHVSAIGSEITREIIEACNKCAHCVPVRPKAMRFYIELWHDSIDNDPCGEPRDRNALKCAKPVEEPCYSDDDGDDDGADWWKKGGQPV